MNKLFGIGESRDDMLNNLSRTDLTHSITDLSPTDGITSPDQPSIGSETTTMHFSITSKLGWITWKETESSLYCLFERAFSATRCELKFSESLTQLAMEVEIPNTQIDKFTKYFNKDILAAQIDKLHGLEPSLSKYRDVKLSGMKRSMGSTLSTINLPSSVEALTTRLNALIACGAARDKEITAITEHAKSLITEMTLRYDTLITRLDAKIHEKCGSKMEEIEDRLLVVVRDDLGFIKGLPQRMAMLYGVPVDPELMPKPDTLRTPGSKITVLSSPTSRVEKSLVVRKSNVDLGSGGSALVSLHSSQRSGKLPPLPDKHVTINDGDDDANDQDTQPIKRNTPEQEIQDNHDAMQDSVQDHDVDGAQESKQTKQLVKQSKEHQDVAQPANQVKTVEPIQQTTLSAPTINTTMNKSTAVDDDYEPEF